MVVITVSGTHMAVTKSTASESAHAASSRMSAVVSNRWGNPPDG